MAERSIVVCLCHLTLDQQQAPLVNEMRNAVRDCCSMTGRSGWCKGCRSFNELAGSIPLHLTVSPVVTFLFDPAASGDQSET